MTTSLRSVFTAWCFGLLVFLPVSLLVAGSAQAQSSAANATALNITLGEQRVRFAPTRSFQEMRLDVSNSLGEIVFTHTTAEAEFDWNLRTANGEALAPGLYSYALALKFSEDQTRQHTGHFIVEKGQDQIWLTASDGAEVSGTALNAARASGRSVAGFRTSEDKQAKREVEGREVVDEKGNKLTNSVKAVKQEKASLLGTLNRVAKFGAGGLADTDSTITEDATGKMGFGVTPSATTPILFNGDINAGLGAGLPAFILQSNLDHARLEMRKAGGGAPIVQGRSSNGTLASPTASTIDNFLGGFGGSGYDPTNGFAPISHGFIGINAAENWTATAHGTYIAFGTTPNGSLTRTEKMRVTGDGNVGIGTNAPTSKLAVSSTAATPAVTVNSTSGEALHGESSPTFGVFGSSVAGNGVAGTGTTGVYGQGSVNGVLGETTVAGGHGVHGKNTVGGNAGFFEGNVNIVGNLTKLSGTFRIDHPLDPANKYLSHSFVESPDMMNIYNGVTQLDRRGRAVVVLPDYFESLNQDFRYQLTCVGGFAPVYIAREMQGNQFVIAGGKPGMKVSWQVTGVRHDAYANDHRIKVEEDKPAQERGTYLYPQGAAQQVKPTIASPLAETRTPMVQRATAKGRR